MTVDQLVADQECVIIGSLVFIIIAGAVDTLIGRGRR